MPQTFHHQEVRFQAWQVFIFEHEFFCCEKLAVYSPPTFVDYPIGALSDLVHQLIKILEEVKIIEIDGGFKGALGDCTRLEGVRSKLREVEGLYFPDFEVNFVMHDGDSLQ